MTTQTWIALADYSLKHKVSISTLRRRIKNQDVEYRLEDGKYFLPDLPLSSPRRAAGAIAPPQMRTGPAAPSFPPVPKIAAFQVSQPRGSPPPSDTALLLGEIKAAFTTIAKEKDQQIRLLRNELTDLKTLVQVLEHENKRLHTVIKETSSLDQWLKASDKEI